MDSSALCKDPLLLLLLLLLLVYGSAALMAPLIFETSQLHAKTHHSRWDSSGQVISPMQIPLPDNIKQSQKTHIRNPSGFETSALTRELHQTHPLTRAATGIGSIEISADFIFLKKVIEFLVCIDCGNLLSV